MATGIISVGLDLERVPLLSAALAAVCLAAWAVLVVLTLLRLALEPARVREDFADPRRAFGFFTVVAGTNVLGVRLAADGHTGWTAALLAVAFGCWLVLGYVVPWTAVLGHTTRPVVAAANGTWFIWVVASQSVAVATATVQPVLAPGWRGGLALLAVVSWAVGIFLYAAAGVFVALRMMLFDLRPVDLDPPYWVAMGACAITVLAGARILEMADAPMVLATRGLVGGLSVVFWAFATWLIPPLVAAGWWRHRRHGVPLGYDASLWSIVFPLGMYAVAGIYLGRADRLPVVGVVGTVELWVALAAWVVVGVAMAVNLWRTVGRAPRQPGGRRPPRPSDAGARR
ncbi:tellurite resistance protein permease [Georgenia thermotolerans]|uniref:Tellurite resistance protein permease n=2 Tax=Georgenia thermotolerans TaxID=527326 RepID=A0A7J5USD1_9MICO|nr:tellurite resistance protein permease [Georgenia thermotolerans]